MDEILNSTESVSEGFLPLLHYNYEDTHSLFSTTLSDAHGQFKQIYHTQLVLPIQNMKRR